ncbi:MAG: acetate--CoA ligase family protein [Alphaproteobacteria bacterium]
MVQKEKFSAERLKRLFAPKSIVVVGGGWADRVIEECKNAGYGGKIYAVHDKKLDVSGIKTYQKVIDLPEAPDACYIAIKHEKSIEVIKELNNMSAGGAIIFAAGFAEVGRMGVERQQRLIKACQHDKLGAMPFLGPNCYGIINMNLGSVMWPDFQGLARVDSGVAIITQSGNIGINLTMQKRGLPVVYMMTMGNQAMVTISDVMRVMADDAAVKAIGLHIEGFGDINNFIKAVQYCHERNKPVVILKTGLSHLGAELTMSHTASLAGGGMAVKAFLQKIGVPQVFDVPEFLEMLKLQMAFGLQKLSPRSFNKNGKRDIKAISFSCSGGEATLMADLCHSINQMTADYDIVFPAMQEKTKQQLDELHGGRVVLSNPFDYQTYIWDDKEAIFKNFNFALETDVDYGILILDIPNRDGMDPWAWHDTYQGFVKGTQLNKRRGIVLASLVETLPSEERCYKLLAEGIAPLAGIETCLKLLSRLEITANYYQPIGMAELYGTEQMLDHQAARKILSDFGLVFVKSQTVNKNNFSQAVKNFKKPVVLKADNIAHKTEQNAVRLNLKDAAVIEKNAKELFAMANDIIIEEMVDDKKLELLLGVNKDAAVGMALVIGEGGMLAELCDDRIFIPLPTTADEITNALRRLKFYPLFLGYRGQKPLNIKAVVKAAMAVNDFAIKYQNNLITLDINPLLVSEKNAIAVDQLMVLKN